MQLTFLKMIEEINESIRRTPRNNQSNIGRQYCIKRLKSNNFDTNGKLWWQIKNGEICRIYKDMFGVCETFKKVKARKKDLVTYMYYEAIKNKYIIADSDGVYIIGNLEHSICKIGYSKNPYKRLKQIQTGCPYPVSVLKYYEGIGKQEEKMLHKKYQRYKLHGEWFEIKGGIKQELLK